LRYGLRERAATVVIHLDQPVLPGLPHERPAQDARATLGARLSKGPLREDLVGEDLDVCQYGIAFRAAATDHSPELVGGDAVPVREDLRARTCRVSQQSHRGSYGPKDRDVW
jgi:hypothetical protein